MQQHEVAFPDHHHLNRLAFELVVTVVPDLVSTPDAHVLVPVLVHLVSPVVLVLDEVAVVLKPFVIPVYVIATRTVVAIVVFAAETVMVAAVFAAETVSMAAVVSGPAVWVHHVWSAHRGRLLQSSSASLASLALRVMPYVAAPLHT